jgi:hypothetical protein
MSEPTTIPLRFQRAELQAKADLSPAGIAMLTRVPGPAELIAALAAMEDPRDAVSSLALMLPRRQTVWWACLGVRLIPDLADRPAELAAIEIAESWVQTQATDDCERAFPAAEACAMNAAAGWAAMAAFWSGPSLAPRGQQAIAPAPHLAGVAARTALIFTFHDPAVTDRIGYGDLLAIGMELMHGELGRRAQAAARERIASGG